MARKRAPRLGEVIWNDLTVPDAEEVRDFYAAVIGWTSTTFDGDFNMIPRGSEVPAAGICWARGVNRDLPPYWLPYFMVADIDRSVRACRTRGGTVLHGPRDMGSGRLCVIRDPAGAVAALYSQKKVRRRRPTAPQE
ncbi:MAG: VOC family protein [Thermoplasmata archaeon]|nr:VOC family protein [Thermoplasmata archaeon]